MATDTFSSTFLSTFTGDSSTSITTGPPAAPGSFTATPLNAAAFATWDLPISGATPTGYTITATSPGEITRTYTLGNALSVTLGDLTNDITWTLVIFARSADGDGLTSTTTVDLTSSSPDPTGSVTNPDPRLTTAPTLLTITASVNAIGVTWDPPADLGETSILNYRIVAEGGGTTTSVLYPPSAVAGTVSPLTNDVLYTVTVYAINVIGASPPSNALTATPSAGLPDIDPGPGDGDGGTVHVPQPSLQAFIQTETFIPANWIGG